ncbi:MAG: nucleotide exchange factor GrpE, partial [Gammaproteobacteria bacterium]|nr:nucleotide exchange factor GrpE [Gammaproteobacteria bacterium]
MNPQHQALLEQFRDYLEESEQWEPIKDTQEDTQEDTQDEQKIDLFTLFSELSALKN